MKGYSGLMCDWSPAQGKNKKTRGEFVIMINSSLSI